MAVLPVSKVVPDRVLPFVHVPVQVYSLRAVWEVGKAMRNCSATPPFSTRSPSGLSEPSPTSVGANGARKFQNVDGWVQKLRAELEMKPVDELVAAKPLASARNTSPVAETVARSESFRLPHQLVHFDRSR